MALALKVVGAIDVADGAELYVHAHLQAGDGTRLASVKTGPAAQQGSGAMWNEELMLPVSTEAAPSIASVLLELWHGHAKDAATAPSSFGFATLDWPTVRQHAVGEGWPVEPPLVSSQGHPVGGRLLVRLLYTDVTSAATRLRDLKGQVSEAMSASAKERSALSVATVEVERQLAAARAQNALRLRSVAQRSTDAEVAAFRGALEKRLEAARSGRDAALRNFNEMHQIALSKCMPRLGERLSRSASQQREAIARVASRARAREAATSGERRIHWATTLVGERQEAIGKLVERTRRASHRIQAAFLRATSHENGALGRRLRHIAQQAEERAVKECASLQPQRDSLAAAISTGRAELDAEAAEAVGAVRLEASRLTSEGQAHQHAHYRAAREQLARTLLEHQARHRDERGARRVVDATAEQGKRVCLGRRETALTERTSATQKEVDALSSWLAKRIEGAHASSEAASSMASALERREELSEQTLTFDAEWADLRNRMETQRGVMSKLNTRLFIARARGTATSQVAEVMSAVEERCLEISRATSSVSSAGMDNLRSELGSLLLDVSKRHESSLKATLTDSESYERALVAPSVRDAPKHRALLSQLEHEMGLATSLSLSRPSEWYVILGRALRLDENTVSEKHERMHAALLAHAEELSSHSARAAQEVLTEEELQERRSAQLAVGTEEAEARVAQQRLRHTHDTAPSVDLSAAVREAVETATAEGEAKALERRRLAFERVDLTRARGATPSLAGGLAGAGAASGSTMSYDARHRPGYSLVTSEVRPGGLGDTDALLKLREHFHRVVAEARSALPHAVAAGTLSMEWSEEAAGGRHRLSSAESDQLTSLEGDLAANLRETIREEHLTFATAIKAAIDERDMLRHSAHASSSASSSVVDGYERRDGIAVGRAEELSAIEAIHDSVVALRVALSEATAAADSVAVSVSEGTGSESATESGGRRLGDMESGGKRLGDMGDGRRAAFRESFTRGCEAARAALGEQISAREEAARAGGEMRSAERHAREVAGHRRDEYLNDEWNDAMERIVGTSSQQLFPVHKRLAAAKRSCAAELVCGLVEESEERGVGLLKYTLNADEAREWARAKQVEALVASHQQDAEDLAALRFSLLEHKQRHPKWANGFVSTLAQVGALQHTSPLATISPPKLTHGRQAGGHQAGGEEVLGDPLGVSGGLVPGEGRGRPHAVVITSNALAPIAERARASFLQAPRHHLHAQLHTRPVRASKPMPPPPLERLPVPSMLAAIQRSLSPETRVRGTGCRVQGSLPPEVAAYGGGGGGRWPWEEVALRQARALHASLTREEEVRLPSGADDLPTEEAAAAAAAAAAVAVAAAAEDDQRVALVRRKAELQRLANEHAAKVRSLEVQAEEEVAAAQRTSLISDADAAAATLADMVGTHAYEEARRAEEAAAEQARRVGRIEEQVAAERVSTSGLNVQLWGDALLRRQGEDATLHGRRLRHMAHDAAKGRLGERGEALKEQLATMRSLIARAKEIKLAEVAEAR